MIARGFGEHLFFSCDVTPMTLPVAVIVGEGYMSGSTVPFQFTPSLLTSASHAFSSVNVIWRGSGNDPHAQLFSCEVPAKNITQVFCSLSFRLNNFLLAQMIILQAVSPLASRFC